MELSVILLPPSEEETDEEAGNDADGMEMD